MSTKQNNLVAVARLSMKLAAKFMRPYSLEQAPKRYTQPQLTTCLDRSQMAEIADAMLVEIVKTSPRQKRR